MMFTDQEQLDFSTSYNRMMHLQQQYLNINLWSATKNNDSSLSCLWSLWAHKEVSQAEHWDFHVF